MTSWGWRIPFIIALLPGTLAVCGRRCIPETSSFVHAQAEAAQAVEVWWELGWNPTKNNKSLGWLHESVTMYTTEQYPQTKFQNISEVWKSLEVLSFQVDRDRPSVKATDFDGQRRYSFAKGRSETLPNDICWFFARQERLRPFKMPKVRWKHSSSPIGQQCGLAWCQLQPLRLYTMLRCHGAMYFFRKEVLQVPVWSWSLALQKTEWVFLVVVAYIHIRRARMPEN